jgi:hypothetical protein
MPSHHYGWERLPELEKSLPPVEIIEHRLNTPDELIKFDPLPQAEAPPPAPVVKKKVAVVKKPVKKGGRK